MARRLSSPVASAPAASVLVALSYLVGCLAVLCSAGCGASIQTVYEGDVRFEQCMALDVQPAVGAGAQRACWHDWVSYYTYGQTRDRLVHAEHRIRQLSGAGPRTLSGGLPALIQLPESPAPPPEGGLDVPTDMSTAQQGAAGIDDGGLEDVRCAGQCQIVHDDCSRACRKLRCRKSCSVGFKSCVRRCG